MNFKKRFAVMQVRMHKESYGRVDLQESGKQIRYVNFRFQKSQGILIAQKFRSLKFTVLQYCSVFLKPLPC